MAQVLIAGFGRKGHAVGDIPGENIYIATWSGWGKDDEREGRGKDITSGWVVVFVWGGGGGGGGLVLEDFQSDKSGLVGEEITTSPSAFVIDLVTEAVLTWIVGIVSVCSSVVCSPWVEGDPR